MQSVFDCLKGKVVTEVLLGSGDTFLVMVTSDGERHRFQSVGDCCAVAVFAEICGLKWLQDKVVTQTESLPCQSETLGEWGNQVDTTFYNIYTKDGVAVQISLRTTHNGYYCGWIESEKDGDEWREWDEPEDLKVLWEAPCPPKEDEPQSLGWAACNSPKPTLGLSIGDLIRSKVAEGVAVNSCNKADESCRNKQEEKNPGDDPDNFTSNFF
jgi:hypothetical protein